MHLGKLIKVFLPTIFFFITSACQNNSPDVYNKGDYIEERRGVIDNYNTILFRNKYNADYTIRKIYSDSLFRDSGFIVFKNFFYKDLLNGPFEGYSYGKLSRKGFYKNNEMHGEFISYDSNGDVSQKQYYDNGKRNGIWEFYNSDRILFKKIYYENGEFVKKDLFNQRTGEFARTEYKEDRFN